VVCDKIQQALLLSKAQAHVEKHHSAFVTSMVFKTTHYEETFFVIKKKRTDSLQPIPNH
jgi:hypothetical protein